MKVTCNYTPSVPSEQLQQVLDTIGHGINETLRFEAETRYDTLEGYTAIVCATPSDINFSLTDQCLIGDNVYSAQVLVKLTRPLNGVDWLIGVDLYLLNDTMFVPSLTKTHYAVFENLHKALLKAKAAKTATKDEPVVTTEDLRDAFEVLSSENKSIVAGTYSGLNPREIAAALSISASTVRRRLKQAFLVEAMKVYSVKKQAPTKKLFS